MRTYKPKNKQVLQETFAVIYILATQQRIQLQHKKHVCFAC